MALLISRLKYPLAALEPFISERTMDCHYNWHYLTYISAANRLIEKTYYHDKDIRKIVSTAVGPIFNNAAQAFNHDFFFSCMIPNAPLIPSRLSEELKRQFRSTDTFLDAFLNSAVSNFGAGWTWLTMDPVTGKMEIRNTSNAGTPLSDGLCPLLCIDIWEHAYYLDYQYRRNDYVAGFMNHIDWNFVAAQYDECLKTFLRKDNAG